MSADADAAEAARARIRAIRADRSARALRGLGLSVLAGQMLFGAFAVGHTVGPSDLPAQDVLLGISAALVVGVGYAWVTARARQERGARWAGRLTEGRRRRRVAVFGDHVTIDREVVVASTVDRAEVDQESLTVRYVDPFLDGPVIRELRGPRADLHRVAAALAPR